MKYCHSGFHKVHLPLKLYQMVGYFVPLYSIRSRKYIIKRCVDRLCQTNFRRNSRCQGFQFKFISM